MTLIGALPFLLNKKKKKKKKKPVMQGPYKYIWTFLCIKINK